VTWKVGENLGKVGNFRSQGKVGDFHWKSLKVSYEVIALDFLCVVSCFVSVWAAKVQSCV